MEQVQFGRRLIQARAKEKGTTVAAQEKQIKNAFGQRKLAQQVKGITGKPRATLRSVNVPSNNNSNARIHCHDKASIEKAFVSEGTRCFSQTNGKPLMQSDFVAHRILG